MEDELNFNELKKECPWHDDGECRVMGDFMDERDSCNEYNCAPKYWICCIFDFIKGESES